MLHHPLRLWIVRDTTNEGMQQPMQPQRSVVLCIKQPQPHQAQQRFLSLTLPATVILSNRQRRQQQITRDRLTRRKAGSAGQQPERQHIHGVVGVKPVVAQGEGTGDM